MTDLTQSDDWQDIKRLKVHPSVHSLEEYQKRVQGALPSAVEYLLEQHLFQDLSVTLLQYSHARVFHTVHPWAGDFRTGAPPRGVPLAGADAQRIGPELQLAILQTRCLVQNEYPALFAATFLYTRFEAIYPFKGGNSTLGRMVLGAQIAQFCSPPPEWSVETGESFSRALSKALDTGDLTDLIHELTTSVGIPKLEGEWKSPFRIDPIHFHDSMLLAPPGAERKYLTPAELMPKTLRRIS